MLSKAKYFILALVFGLGFYLGSKFNQPKPVAPPPEISQKQSQSQGQKSGCVAVQKKITHPDGSIEESFNFSAENNQSQAQDQKQEIKPVKASSGGFYLGGAISTKFQAKAAAEAVFNSNSVEILTDFKTDHVLIYKKRLIEW